MTGLQYLWLNSNGLTGSIPDSIGKMTVLQTLYLQNNSLTNWVNP
jgi:Leucine-rich repeat (LRR) protein